jgi:hypothetical protein
MYGQDQIINSEIAWQAGRLRPRHLAANVHEISEARQPPDNVKCTLLLYAVHFLSGAGDALLISFVTAHAAKSKCIHRDALHDTVDTNVDNRDL